MDKKFTEVRATCLCGFSAHTLDLSSSALPLTSRFCHCTSCRHMSGVLAVTIAYLRSYAPALNVTGRLQTFAFSDRITYYLCSKCGTHVYCRNGDQWAICTGALQHAEGIIDVDAHLHVADTVDGGLSEFVANVGGQKIERWPGKVNEGEILPLHWKAPDVEQPPSAIERLHARCLCGGVEFWVSRPSEESSAGKPTWDDYDPPGTPDSEPEDFAWWICDNETKYRATVCPCESCRLGCGMEWMQWAYIPSSNITLDEAGKVPFPQEERSFGTLKQHHTSSNVARSFCGVCGATVFSDSEDRPHLLNVGVGLFDAPDGARAESWLQWRTARMTHRKEALARAENLTLAMEDGLKTHEEWSQAEQDTR